MGTPTQWAVYELSDRELVKGAHLIGQRAVELQLPATEWEKKFCVGIVEQYMRALRLPGSNGGSCARSSPR